MIVPGQAPYTERFDGFLWLENEALLSSLPISAQTLILESMAAHFPENPVYISSRITEGTLSARLSDAKAAYGDRLWLLIAPYRHDLHLPDTENALVQTDSPPPTESVFYSDAFFCNYRIFPDEKRLYLFDTEQTVQKKVALAESLGIGHILILP